MEDKIEMVKNESEAFLTTAQIEAFYGTPEGQEQIARAVREIVEGAD